MTEVATITEKEVVEKDVVVAPPVIVGGLVVIGAHLISTRMLEMIALLSDDISPNGIATLVFRDDNHPQVDGEPIHAKFFSDSLSIMVNVNRHIAEVFTQLEEKDCAASFRALYWETTLDSIAHELLHARAYLKAPEDKKSTIFDDPEHEKTVEQHSRLALFDIAKDGHNVEPPLVDEDPILKVQVDAIIKMVEESGDELEENDWIKRQVRYLKENTMFEDENGRRYMTFKSFLRALSDDYENPAWDEATVTVQTEVKETEVAPEQHTTKDESDVPPWDWEPDTEIPEDGANLDGMMDQMFSASEAPAMAEALIPEVMPATNANINTAPTTQALPIADNPGAVPAKNAYVPEQWQNTGSGSPVTQFPQQQAVVPSLPVVNMPVEQQKQVVAQVFTRLWYNMFGKCVFNKDLPNSFGHETGILENSVNILDIPGADQIFLSHDFGEQDTARGGMTMDAPLTNGVLGYVTKSIRLPAYSMWVNRGGFKKQLKMIPQNPDKRYADGHQMAGQLKPMAVKVRHHGSAIAWIMEETPRGMDSNYLLVIEMDQGQSLSIRWL